MTDSYAGVRGYRRKPIIIEISDPLTTENIEAVAAWCNGAVRNPELGLPWLTVSALGGEVVADIGDRVCRGVKGEFYPIKPDIFAETYEPEWYPYKFVDP